MRSDLRANPYAQIRQPRDRGRSSHAVARPMTPIRLLGDVAAFAGAPATRTSLDVPRTRRYGRSQISRRAGGVCLGGGAALKLGRF